MKTLTLLVLMLGLGAIVGYDVRQPAEASGDCGMVRVDCTTHHVEPAAKIIIPEGNVTGLTDDLAAKVGTSTLTNYETTAAHASSLTNYQTTAGMTDYQTTAGMSAYVQTSVMASYQTTAAMTNYATTATLTNYIATSRIGAASGVAGLDTASKVSTANIPDLSSTYVPWSNVESTGTATSTATDKLVNAGDSRLSDARAPTGNIAVVAPLALYSGTASTTSTATSLASTPTIGLPGDGNSAHYLNGAGAYTTPAGGGGGGGGGGLDDFRSHYGTIGIGLLGLTAPAFTAFYVPFMRLVPGTASESLEFRNNTTNTRLGGIAGLLSSSGSGVLLVQASAANNSQAQADMLGVALAGSPFTVAWYVAFRAKFSAVNAAAYVYFHLLAGDDDLALGLDGSVDTVNIRMLNNYTGGTDSVVVASADTAWHVLEMWGTATTTIYARMDGGDTKSFAAHTTGWATTGVYPSVYAYNGSGGAARSISVDEFLLVVPPSP
jgi:hypothetical protein